MVGLGDPQQSPPPAPPTQQIRYSTGMSSAVRSPSGSGTPSPTDGTGLSRRLSWNSSHGEAISMRDLAGSVLVSGASAGIGPSPGAGGGASSGGTDGQDFGALQYPSSSSHHHNTGTHPLPSPLNVTEHGSFHTPVRVFDSVGSSSQHHHPGYASSQHSDNDLEHLTPNGPDSNSNSGDRRSPSGRRVYDSDGRARSSPLGRIARSPTVRRVSNTLRFAGERVVNIMGDKSDKGAYENLIRVQTLDDDSPISEVPSHQLPLHDSPSPPPLMHVPPLAVGLRGRTLGFFTAKNPVRRAMDRILHWTWTEPIILALILLNVVVLTAQSWVPIFEPRSPYGGYFRSWQDTALFVLFIIFTVEMCARMIVTGLIIDPETRTKQWFKDNYDFYMRRAKAQDDPTQPKREDTWQQRRKASIGMPGKLPKRTVTNLVVSEAPFQKVVQRQHEVLRENRPYLRHSWHRIDMLAIIMFWITFIVAISGQEIRDDRHLYIFRALSVLRASRLLVITAGTATILHSLKRAGPLILNVSVFAIFAAALFSIIGVQSFRGSLRRVCVIVDETDPSNNVYLNGTTCGGWISPTLAHMSFWKEPGDNGVRAPSEIPPKGYLCPIDQQCYTVSWTPESNSISFDNIFMSLVQVLVIAGVNTWTSTMYMIMSSEYFASCIFFIVAIIVLNFWLMNLLVAVVVNTFKDIRSETKKSAFGADDAIIHQPEWAAATKKPKEPSMLLKWYNKTQVIWVLLVVTDVMAQAVKTADSSQRVLGILRNMEIGFVFVWDLEIIIRIAAYSPDWRAFLRSGRNDFDLFLAVGCSIIQIPPIRNASVYPWLTILQFLRWYRFVIVFPRMRPLLINVFGSFAGMINMILFLLLVNFLSALMAVQFLRGDMGNEEMVNFSQAYNSFIGMYQIFSTENWTTVLYGAMGAEWGFGQGWIVCIFLMVWFFFANFILMQMFIAVINENFELAEELKRKEQIEAFVRKTEPTSMHVNWIDRLNPYRLIKARHKAVKVDQLPPNLILPLKQSIGADVGAPKIPETDTKGAKAAMRRMFGLESVAEAFPMRSVTSKHIGRSSSAVDVHTDFDDDYDDDRGLAELLPPLNAGPSVDEHVDLMRERRNQQADFIAAHPSFDKSLWFFKQDNPIRQMCQAVVPPAYGERIYGQPAKPLLSLLFRVLLLFSVIASITVFGIAVPRYRRSYYAQYGEIRATWFDMTETALAAIFLAEAIIKIIADGFIFSPNAYLLSVWNLVDFVILITILINTVSNFIVIGGVSRTTRAIKAFRALRLVTLFSRLRDTFHAVFFAGAIRIADASILMILYIIPFAVWGLNIFSGKLASCNDGGDTISGVVDCVSEYMASPVADYSFMAPRVWANPRFGASVWAFDSFRESMLILFEIVSLEGWTDVMSSAMDIVGVNQQPSTNNQQWNSLFFLIFNLLGAVIILTIFLSIIIENFSIRSGTALLTSEQNQWVDLAKFIRQQTPSQLPQHRPTTGFRSWCYDRAVDKRGYWTRAYTALYFVHIILLMMQDYSNNVMSETTLDWVFLILTVIYAVDVVVRFIGLGFHSFRSNGWNLFDVVVITGSFVTTIPALEGSIAGGHSSQAMKQVQKLFLVSVTLKLVQRLDSLNQLFKTAVASLPAIGNLFLLWAVVFIFMAIVMTELFGLTKMGNSAASVYQNFNDFGSAFVMLAFMSTGEGWNGFMHDYTVEFPRCTPNSNYLKDDCGSVGWSYVMFIFWNILSMYIFLNMFTGVVVQSFAYVYQSPGGASLTREQIRSFKRVWAEIDTNRTGYIRRKDFTRFFAKLTGVFEVRLYAVEHSVPNILRASVPDPETPAKRIETGVHYSVEVRKLRQQIAQIDYVKVRERRRQYVRLFNEAKMSEEPNRGISFTNMLMMLAHYKLIDDEAALQVDELLIRRAKMERVEDLVNLDRVRGLLRTIYWRRRFIKHRSEKRILAAQAHGIPAIVLNPDGDGHGVDRLPGDPLQGGAQMYYTPAASATSVAPSTPERGGRMSTGPPRSPHTPPPRHSMSPSRGSPGGIDPIDRSNPNLSVSSTGTLFTHPQANTSNASYTTALSVTPTGSSDRRTSMESRISHGAFRQRDSMFDDDGDDDLSAMATSVWANMMQEAVNAEDDEEY